MKVVNISGKDYTFEFTIEASLYDECTERTIGLMHQSAMAAESGDEHGFFSSLANMPKVALSMFYAGLLEHHGINGDNSVPDIGTAKKILKAYMVEHKDDGTGDFYSVMEEMLSVMSDDGFFSLIGLEKMIGIQQTEKTAKVPQDHKKKTTRVSAK